MLTGQGLGQLHMQTNHHGKFDMSIQQRNQSNAQVHRLTGHADR